MNSSQPRRHFLGRISAALAGIVIGPGMATGQATTAGSAVNPEHDAWMDGLKGKHRQIFHDTVARDLAMLMASNYLDAYVNEFQAGPGEVNAVIGVHGGALSLGFNDAAWAKYSLGKASNVTDPKTNAPSVRNIFTGGAPLSVDTLQKRGVVFLMCNTALRLRSRALAAERGEPYETVYEDLRSSRLPGTILVPALVVAINRAQERGFTYVRV